MADPARARKLADRIKVVVAETLEQRIKDPRVGFLTITDARVTGDLHDATVYYTVYGSEEEKAGTAAALESAKGVLRSEIGRQTGVRFTPTLTFVADAVPENAAAIEDLLAAAAAAAAVARAAGLAQGQATASGGTFTPDQATVVMTIRGSSAPSSIGQVGIDEIAIGEPAAGFDVSKRREIREAIRERVAALAEPVGLSVEQVRDELGVESFFRRREHGCELTWRVGSMELVLAFDSKRLCTGIVAARGLPIT